jgi:LPS export ABC transporter protein LptC
MRKTTGILFAIFMIFLFLEILVGFPIHLENAPEPTPLAEGEKSKDPKKSDSDANKTETQQKALGVHLVESQKGNQDWELFAESAENSQGKGAWQLKNVKVLFYNNETVDFTVTGERGTLNSDTKDMKIAGHVITKSANGYTFESESVSYIAAQRLIQSLDPIKMIGPPDDKGKGLVLTGGKMQAQVDESKITIQKDVAASKQLSNGKKFIIKSQIAEFSGKNRTAKFLEDVSIDVGSLKMQGPEAYFEYRSGADILQSIVVKGGVKVSDVDKYATSDSVKFDPEQNQFIFNGRPRVVQNNDEITGDQIVFIDGGKKVKVENIKGKVDQK